MASRSRLFVLILLFQVFQINAQIRNVAFNKPTNQSSTYSDNDAGNAVSSRAVDGNTNSDYYSGKSCSHTRLGSPGWWCVDLQQVFNITNITIYNRNRHQYRLQGFEIKLGSDDQCNESGFISATSCYKDTAATVQSIYTIHRCNQQPSTSLAARTVFIKATDMLTLCEVQIFTGCTDGDCGCDDNCLSCYTTTGVCISCKPGWFGTNCQQQCSNNCNNGGCKQGDGYCNNGCTEGWYGDTCNTSCNQQCSSGCSRSTGQCSMCKSGWYGTNCETSCSSNCTEECNKSTGRCTECKPGIFGNDCNKPCPVNCIGNCTRDEGKCNICKPNTVGQYCNATCGTECLPITDGTQETCDRDGRCTECIVRRYGDECDETCSTACEGTCDRDGKCTECIIGRYGDECDQTCSTACEGTCDRDGKCTECTVGRYGDGCDKNCSTTCEGRCDKTNGRCSLCIKGYSGATCDKDCNDNCTVCDQDDINNCSQCKDGRWGTSCNKQCSSNCAVKCNKLDGLCFICNLGWYGTHCHTKCSGNCTDGCNRLSGICTQDKNKDEDVSPIVGGVIGAIFGVLITVVVGVTIYCYLIKRKQLSKSVSESRGYRYNNQLTVNTPTTRGDNSTSDDITYDTLQQVSTQQDEAVNQYQTLNPDPAYVNLGLQYG